MRDGKPRDPVAELRTFLGLKSLRCAERLELVVPAESVERARPLVNAELTIEHVAADGARTALTFQIDNRRARSTARPADPLRLPANGRAAS